MTAVPWTLRALRRALADGITSPSELAETALARSNGNAEPQHLPLAGRRVDARGSRACRGHAAFEWRAVRRWPPRAVGPAYLSEGLLRPRRLAHHVRRAFLSRSERHGHARLLAGGAITRSRRRDRGQNPPSSAGLRNHRRESGVWRLRAATRFRRAHRRLFKRRSRQRAGGFGRGRHRHRHRRLRSRARGARAGWPAIAPPSAAATGAAARTWPNPSTPWAGSFATSKMRRFWPRRLPLSKTRNDNSLHTFRDFLATNFSTIASRR